VTADLDEDERPWRARLQRHEIDLVATDANACGKDGPTQPFDVASSQRFGAVSVTPA
jgi:hypothetical protein